MAEEARTNVTFKFGPGYEAPWLTVGGTPAEIAAQIEEIKRLDLESTIIEFSTMINAQYKVGQPTNSGGLGATAVRKPTPEQVGLGKAPEAAPAAPAATAAKPAARKPSTTRKAAAPKPESAPEKPQEPAGDTPSEPVDDGVNPVLAAIQGAATESALKNVAFKNNDVIKNDTSLQAAYKTRMSEITGK